MSGQSSPFEGVEPTEKAQRALSRLRETFGVEEIPSGLSTLVGSENGIHDVYMNLKRQFDGGKVEKKHKLLVAVGVSTAFGSSEATRYLGAVAREAGATGEELLDTAGIATVCSVFNGYYHFRDLAPKGEFDSFKAPFNANIFMKNTLGTALMEMICIAVSSMNGCHMCVHGHIQKAKSVDVSAEQIDEVIKAGAAAQALAAVSSALGGNPAPVTA